MNELEALAEIESLQRPEVRRNCKYRGKVETERYFVCNAPRTIANFCKLAVNFGEGIYCTGGNWFK